MEVANASESRRPERQALGAETLAAAVRGERWATRGVVEATQAMVYRYAWRMLGGRATPAATEELVQDVYARVFRALPRYRVDGPARFTTWLLTIAHRTVVDELRRRRPSTVPLPDDEVGTALDRPDHQHERSELGRHIAIAVERLSPALRSAFILRAYHERSLLEIASALEIDEGTVKSRLHRARQTLQRALEEVHDDA